MLAKLSSVRIIVAASRATSVPDRPIAMPMSARFERGRVVDAVAGHRDDLAERLERVGDAQLRLGGVAGEDDLPVFGDAYPLGDRLGGEAVVAGDDHHADAGLMAARDRVGDLGAGRVEQAHEADQAQLARRPARGRRSAGEIDDAVRRAAYTGRCTVGAATTDPCVRPYPVGRLSGLSPVNI